jgi:hypothetical protein
MRCPFCRKGLADKVMPGHLRSFHDKPAYADLMAIALCLRDEELQAEVRVPVKGGPR